MLFIDSRHKGVSVPENLKNDFQLRLNYDYSYQIADFQVFGDRVEASLSFNHRNYFCVVPFEAVYLMVSHTSQHAVLFLHSVPVEMLDYFSKEAKKQEKIQEQKDKRPSMKVVETHSKQNRSSDETGKVKRTGHLRVVK